MSPCWGKALAKVPGGIRRKRKDMPREKKRKKRKTFGGTATKGIREKRESRSETKTEHVGKKKLVFFRKKDKKRGTT